MKHSIAVGARRAGSRVFYGWYIVAACATIAAFSWGLGFYGLGVYLDALRDRHGWSTGLISLAMTAYYLTGAAAVLAVGSLIDRHGPRPVLAYGAVVLGGCVAALGWIAAPWQLFAVYVLMATGYASLGATAIGATLLPWFQQRRGRAMSIALTGPSVGGIVLVPLLVSLTHRHGFRVAVLAAGALLCATVLTLVALVIKRRPQDLGLLPDGTPRGADPAAVARAAAARDRRWSRAAALRSPLFWTLVIPFSLAVSIQVGFIVHQLAFLEPALGKTNAALAISATTLAALAGRLVMGLLADRLDRRLFAAACFAVQGAGLALLATASAPAALYIGSLALGLGVGIVITLPALLADDEFGTPSFGTVFAMVSAGMQLSVGAGPSVVGLLRDRTGGYDAALWLLVALEAVAAAIVLAGRRARRGANANRA